MNYGDSGLSASDVALLTGNAGNNNGGFGNTDGSWWIIIFLIFAFLGWGRNGFGGNECGNGGAGNMYGFNACCAPATQQGMADAFNFSQLDNATRAISNGLCDGFYAVNTGILNLGQTLLTCCCDVKTGIMQNGYETRDAINMNSNAIQGQLCQGFNGINQAINNIGYNIQDCCCKTQRSVDNVNYNMAKNTCDIIQAGNANTQRIIDYLTQNEITSLRTELQSAQLQLSNNAQTRNIISELRDTNCPIPSYIVPNPNCCYNYGLGLANNQNGCCAGY